jgi:hypothetical protein
MIAEKETLKIGKGLPGPGRPKGVPNKANALLKDAILQAAEEAGGEGGMVQYLRKQAIDNPGPFMALLGKVLPTQIEGGANPILHAGRIELVAVRPNVSQD